MGLKGVKCVRGFIPLEEHQRCMSQELGPPCGIEPSILELMTRANTEREGIIFSPSSLSACHRQAVLQGEHDWYLDVKQAYKTIRGSIVHQGMSQEPPYPGVLGVVRELRMNAPINTKYGMQTFHGKPDLVVLLGTELVMPEQQATERGELLTMQGRIRLHVKIVDYKTVSEVSHKLVAPYPSNVLQINAYAWIVQQFLPGYLRQFGEIADNDEPLPDEYAEHLFLNENWPITLTRIDEVVVDELSIIYMDMVKTRTFTSKGFLYDQGKQLGDYINGRWVRRYPIEHEELELEPIHQFKPEYVASKIRRGIEEQIEAEKELAAPLTGDAAELSCRNCPVRQVCYDIGIEQGYTMEDQKSYVDTGDKPFNA